MRRKPVKVGVCGGFGLDAWQDKRNFGLKFSGYLKVPRDGMYHLCSDSPTQAAVFICNDAKELQAPAVVASSYRARQGEGSAALRAGLHKLRIEYMQAWNNPHRLGIEVEGPEIPRQALPKSWLFRQRMGHAEER